MVCSAFARRCCLARSLGDPVDLGDSAIASRLGRDRIRRETGGRWNGSRVRRPSKSRNSRARPISGNPVDLGDPVSDSSFLKFGARPRENRWSVGWLSISADPWRSRGHRRPSDLGCRRKMSISAPTVTATDAISFSSPLRGDPVAFGAPATQPPWRPRGTRSSRHAVWGFKSDLF